MALRRLAMLEPVYRLAPDLLKSGRVTLPAGDTAVTRDVRMTDFRLLRHGGFYHAVARYGPDLWTPFTYAGIHATERVLRRKEQHRFWGVDCYSSEEGRYFRIGNRTFYDDPDQEVEPSAQVVVAVDAWACELAWSTLSGNTPTIFCTPDGNCTPAVELRPSRDLVSDPSGHPSVGRPESAGQWLRRNPDMAAIDGRLAHRLFLAVCQFPAMRASWLSEVVAGSPGEVSRHLRRFVDTGLVVFDGRHYLSELGMRRAANMSRVLPDLLLQVGAGTLGAGTHCIEFERYSPVPAQVGLSVLNCELFDGRSRCNASPWRECPKSICMSRFVNRRAIQFANVCLHVEAKFFHVRRYTRGLVR